MKTSVAYRKLIVKEMEFAINRMNKVQDAVDKLYYFSAVFGVLHRVYNMEFDSELLFAHFILRATHDGFLNRTNAITKGGETAVKLNDKQFEKISILSKELVSKIKKQDDISETLKKFVNLTYSTTGNGYYLMEKGWLQI